MGKTRGRAARARKPKIAARLDRYELYETALHEPAAEVDFIRKTFRARRGRQPLTFREDFAGAGSAACEWVRRGPRYRAIGVDIDPVVIEWGMAASSRASDTG